MPAVSTSECVTVIVNYNAGVLLVPCVASAFESGSDTVVVVDNASADDSLQQLETHFPDEARLTIIRNEYNLGFAKACNIGASHAGQRDILFLNPDCVLAKDALSSMKNALYSTEDAGMVGGFLCNPDGSEQRGGRRNIPNPFNSMMQAFGLHRLFSRSNTSAGINLHETARPDHVVEVEAISGACMLVKSKAIADAGLWDERYFLHCEDLDWCMRLHLKGWKILFDPAARVMHQQGSCSRSRPVFVEWHKHRGMLLFYDTFFRRKYPVLLWWMVIVAVYARFAVIATTYSLARLTRSRSA